MRHVHRFGLCLIRTSAVQNRIKTIFDSLFLLLPARLEAVAATTQIILLLRRSIFYIFAHKFISYKWTAYVTRTTKHYVQDFPYKRTIGLYVESWTSWRATWLKNVAVDVTSMRSCYGGKSYGGRGGCRPANRNIFKRGILSYEVVVDLSKAARTTCRKMLRILRGQIDRLFPPFNEHLTNRYKPSRWFV